MTPPSYLKIVRSYFPRTLFDHADKLSGARTLSWKRQSAFSTCTSDRSLIYTHQHDQNEKFPIRLMPLGGSVTYGVGSTDGNGFRKHLLDMLLSNNIEIRMVGSRNCGSMNNNDNEGWRGYRLDQIHNKAKQSIQALLPNIFVINAGSNDCIQDYRLDSFMERMSSLLDYLWLASPGSTAILSTLLVNSNKEIDSRVIYVNDQIRHLAQLRAAQQRRIALVDMYSPQGPQTSDLVDDGTHPNDIGYTKMAELWCEGIRHAALKGLIGEF